MGTWADVGCRVGGQKIEHDGPALEDCQTSGPFWDTLSILRGHIRV